MLKGLLIWTLAVLMLTACNSVTTQDLAEPTTKTDVTSTGSSGSSGSSGSTASSASSADGTDNPAATPETSTETIDGVTTETLSFKAGTTYRSRELDIVWVIDNSGSMSEEIEHVRKNLRNFVSYVSGFASLRTVVISRTATSSVDNNHSLDTGDLLTSSQFYSINHLIHSLDGVFWASKFFCKDPANCQDALSKPFCKDDVCRSRYQDLSSLGANQILRATSNKVVVFVTDDESTEMSADRFQSIYSSHFSLSKLKVFSFVTLSESDSPCGERTGEVYKSLSSKTGGRSFNICDLDWRPHFEEIANALEKIVKNVFIFGSNRTVLSVKINGAAIPASDYIVSGESLSIQSTLLNENADVEIKVSVQ